MQAAHLVLLLVSQHRACTAHTGPGLKTSSSASRALFFGVDLPLCEVCPTALLWDAAFPAWDTAFPARSCLVRTVGADARACLCQAVGMSGAIKNVLYHLSLMYPQDQILLLSVRDA